ncbi:MAG: hypothetical protein AUI11_03685 [Acidobacteria bacterium 13_2_20CM_2_66_4]|nr:MAG: hypothetical protein AUI11_03685 [Acidobacteria bacterium 13_2_20CM_2_66_4]
MAQRRSGSAAAPIRLRQEQPRADGAQRIVRLARERDGRRRVPLHGVEIVDGEVDERGRVRDRGPNRGV